jgi:hypothetical protein
LRQTYAYYGSRNNNNNNSNTTTTTIARAAITTTTSLAVPFTQIKQILRLDSVAIKLSTVCQKVGV